MKTTSVARAASRRSSTRVGAVRPARHGAAPGEAAAAAGWPARRRPPVPCRRHGCAGRRQADRATRRSRGALVVVTVGDDVPAWAPERTPQCVRQPAAAEAEKETVTGPRSPEESSARFPCPLVWCGRVAAEVSLQSSTNTVQVRLVFVRVDVRRARHRIEHRLGNMLRQGESGSGDRQGRRAGARRTRWGPRRAAAIVARRTRAGHRLSRGGRSAHGRSASEVGGTCTGRQVPGGVLTRANTRADEKCRRNGTGSPDFRRPNPEGQCASPGCPE